MDIKDIAKLAGVSTKTVQRVLNDSQHVKKETREHIQHIMSEHNYYPNVSARRLAKKKTQTLGLFIVQDPKKDNIYADDFFYSSVISQMITSAGDRGYKMLVTTTSVEDASPILKLYREKSIDAGMIISWSDIQETVDKILDYGYPVGVFDQNNLPERMEKVPVPELLNKESAFEATRHLISLGHQLIGIIAGEATNQAALERLEGYTSAMARAGLEAGPYYHGTFVEASGEEAVRSWISEETLPTAIFCSNDEIAVGALKALKQHDISVPDQVSLMGFDNIKITEYTTPTLSTMHVPRVEMADHLVEQMISQAEGSESVKKKYFTASLIERGSTAGPRRKKDSSD
ncbi:Transcriptional (co)regulator CytR [Alkalibacterium sp. AK22]|uniref:LacI family DNA-binding transcriptional regulator n=1 Tax=Alkalibacterium sp. AK22 TaxID=1229520 RepID=UPI00044730BB|nr:LacI family DNA-binding transcriptional regulator [Alkalibacterium sp. AK22]EXJ23277.1 Transcriptional (co)regulator CytR [Alkalibacterium sp. AK22]